MHGEQELYVLHCKLASGLLLFPKADFLLLFFFASTVQVQAVVSELTHQLTHTTTRTQTHTH